MRTARDAALVRIAAAAVTALAACSHAPPPEDASGDRRPNAREMCRIAFRACAPPATYAVDTDVGKLRIRSLVQISARLDVPDELAERAAERFQKLAGTADTAALLEMEAALDEVVPWSERCRCKEFRSELEKRGIAGVVAARLPPRETRTPEHWVEAIITRLDAIRALKRNAAELVNAADTSGASEAAQEKVAEAQRGLCETVRAARGPLSPEAFESMLGMVHAKQRSSAGEGSAEVAKRMLDEFKDSGTCEAGAPE